MSLIPKAGKIDVPNAPNISPVDLIKQIVENVSAQISLLDVEIFAAQDSAPQEVSFKFLPTLFKY